MASGTEGENNGAPLVGTAVCFLVLTYISVALRTYVRAVLTKSFLLDDWLMLVAQVCIFMGFKKGTRLAEACKRLTSCDRPSSRRHAPSY
jgi:urea transporter